MWGRKKAERGLVVLHRLYHYSGAEFIWRKFFPTNGDLPTGWIWLISIYFAGFAFTSQRYENRCAHVENEYGIFINQTLSGAPFDVDRLTEILESRIPFQPDVWNVASIFKSFFYPQYWFGHFYETFERDSVDSYDDVSNALPFHIRQWKHKLCMAEFSDLSLEGIDLAEGNLTRSDILDVNFNSAYMSKCDLTGSKIHLSYFQYADLANAYLIRAEFNGVHCENATLRGSKLNNIHIYNSHCAEAAFRSAKINNATILSSNFYRSDFYKSSLNNSTFKYSNFQEAYFIDSHVQQTSWEDVNLCNATFHNSKLSESKFTNSNLNNVNFMNANLNGVVFINTSLDGADMSGANLKNITVDLEVLVGVKSLSGAVNIPDEIIMGIKRLKREDLFNAPPRNEGGGNHL